MSKSVHDSHRAASEPSICAFIAWYKWHVVEREALVGNMSDVMMLEELRCTGSAQAAHKDSPSMKTN